MSGAILLLSFVVALALGYFLQRKYEKTATFGLVFMLGSMLLALIVPKYNGFDMFNLFGLSMLFGFGVSLASKRTEALKKKAEFEKLKTERPQYRHCPSCRSKLEMRLIDNEKERLACTHCQFVFWNNPLPVSVAVVPHKDGIVLVKRGVEPRKGTWALPAGFMEAGETPEQGACREAKEEANIDIEIDYPLFSFAPPKAAQVLLFHVAKEIDQTPQPGSDALEARVFPLDALPEEIAFTSHAEAIQRWRVKSGR